MFFYGAHTVRVLSHLLQAACHHAVENGFHVQYLPMAEVLDLPPLAICDGLEQFDLVCVDDIDHCYANESWQEALFNLFNELKERKCLFACSSHSSPSELNIPLADLRSRLLSSAVFQVQPLSDTGLKNALIQRALSRGLEMSEDVANFIILRSPRDSKFLFGLLDELDRLSLQEQRKLTAPFVRQVLIDGGIMEG